MRVSACLFPRAVRHTLFRNPTVGENSTSLFKKDIRFAVTGGEMSEQQLPRPAVARKCRRLGRSAMESLCRALAPAAVKRAFVVQEVDIPQLHAELRQIQRIADIGIAARFASGKGERGIRNQGAVAAVEVRPLQQTFISLVGNIVFVAGFPVQFARSGFLPHNKTGTGYAVRGAR